MVAAAGAMAFASVQGAVVKCVGENNNYDFFRFGSYEKSGETKKIWEDGLPPSPENDYVIPTSRTPNTPSSGDAGKTTATGYPAGTNFVFQGKSLALDGSSATMGLWTKEPTTIEFPNLEFKKGIMRARTTGDDVCQVRGNINVTATASSPAYFRTTCTESHKATIKLAAKLTGSTSAAMQVDPYQKTVNTTYYPGNARLALFGDCSEYFGTIKVNGFTNSLQLACAELPAAVTVAGHCFLEAVGEQVAVKSITAAESSSNGMSEGADEIEIDIAPTNTLIVGDLTLAGGKIVYEANAQHQVGMIVVTNSLTVTAPVTLDASALTAWLTDEDDPVCFNLLKIPSEKGELDPALFPVKLPQAASFKVGSSSTKLQGGLPRWSTRTNLVEEADGSSSWAIQIFTRPVAVRMTNSQNHTDANWTSGTSPNADTDYMVPYQSSGTKPWPAADGFGKGPYNLEFTVANPKFLGHSLTAQCQLYLQASEVEIDDLTLVQGINYNGAGSWLTLYDNKATLPTVDGYPTVTFKGSTLNVVTDSKGNFQPAGVMIRSSGGRRLAVDTEIVGSGDLTIEHPANEGGPKGGYVQFMRANTSYEGKIMVAHMGDITTGSSPKYYTPAREPNITLLVKDEDELGGKLSSFTFDALYLRRWGCLQNVGDLTLTETAKRGLYVEGNGHIRTPEGTTLTMNRRLTMAGELYKSGKGALVLGATTAPKFTSKQSDWSDALGGTNVVKVAEGAFGAATRAASAGLAVTFTEAGSLLADANATGDQATYGYDASSTGSSVTGIDGKIPLTVKGEVGVQDDITVAALTLPSTAATPTFTLVGKPYRGAKIASVESVSNDDGTVTYHVKVTLAGAIMFIR